MGTREELDEVGRGASERGDLPACGADPARPSAESKPLSVLNAERREEREREERERVQHAAEIFNVAAMLGKVLVARSLSRFLNTSALMWLRDFKKNKRYRRPGPITLFSVKTGEPVTVSTWAAFCEHGIGMSATTIDEQLLNLDAFGEEALESMKRVGLGYRELRRLRQLPADERTVVLERIEVDVGDKEAIVELIEEQAAKHAREKAALEQRAEELAGELEAARRLTQEKDEKLNELSTKLYMFRGLPPEEKALELSHKLDLAAIEGIGSLLGMRAVIAEIFKSEEHPDWLFNACALAIARIRRELNDLQDAFHLQDVDWPTDDKSWMGDDLPSPLQASECVPPGADPNAIEIEDVIERLAAEAAERQGGEPA